MYMTKKHLSRRTVLRGAGVTLALPFLDAMVPARTLLAQTAAVPPRRASSGSFRRTAGPAPTGTTADASMLAPTEGRNIGLGFIHAPLAPFQDQLTIVAGLDGTSSMPPAGTTGGDHARARRRPDRCTTEPHRHSPRHQRRSVHRAEVRAERPAAVAAGRYRGSGFEHRRVRLGLQLRLYQLDFMGRREQAAAARSQSAGRLRAPVWRRCLAGRAAGAQEDERQHPRPGDGAHLRREQDARRRRPVAAERVSRERPRGRAPGAVVGQTPCWRRRRSTCRPAPPARSTSTSS